MGVEAMSILTQQTLLFQQKSHLFLTPPSISHFPAISSLSQSSPASSSSISSILSTEFKKGRRIPFMTTASAASTTTGSSEGLSEILGDVSIFTAAGESVMFKELWDQKEGMAVVALLRHFGCPCCWELALTLKDAMPRFDAAGVKLIAVGVGTPDKARLLAERLPFPMDVLYADPNRKAYDVLGLYYGFGRTFFNPASAKVFSRYEALQKAVKNYTIEATPTDRSSVLQQGGIFVFKGKELIYARKDEGTGDHAPLEEILDICCTSPVA